MNRNSIIRLMSIPVMACFLFIADLCIFQSDDALALHQQLITQNKDVSSIARNPVKPLVASPDLKQFIKEFLGKRYQYWGLPDDLASRIIDILTDNAYDLKKARQKLYAKVIDFEDDPRWIEAYSKYKDATKYTSTFRQVEGLMKDLPPGTKILDVGCGNNAFGAMIAENLPQTIVIGTDVLDYHEKRSIPNLSYAKQSSPTTFPEGIFDVDIITMNAVFHHVSSEFIDDFIKEIIRVLKPQGKVILIEDTYSLELPAGSDSDSQLTAKFLELVKKHGAQFAKDFFAFNDWYANIVVHKWDEMALPYEFRSMEEWREVFGQKGLESLSGEHLGFPETGFHKPGLGVLEFILKESAKVVKSEDNAGI